MPLGGWWGQVERGTAAGETGAAAALLPHGTVRRKRAGQPLDKPSHARGQANFLQLVSKTGAGFCHPQNVSLQQELRLRGRKHVEGAAVPRALRGRALGGRGPLRERERRGSSSVVRRAASSSASPRRRARRRGSASRAAPRRRPCRSRRQRQHRHVPPLREARQHHRAVRAARPRRIRRTSARRRARGAVSTH